MKTLPVRILGPDGRPWSSERPGTDSTRAQSWKRGRFEGAEANRLNSAHWANVNGQHINKEIAADLATLRDRSNFELANNAMAAGVVSTYVCDVVGRDGPTLQVVSDRSASYGKRLEDLFWKFWELPDLNGQLSGADLLQLWVRSLWPNGEYFYQYAPVEDAIDFRLNTIAPQRVQTPLGQLNNRLITLGVLRTETGRPETYYITQEDFHELTYPNVAAYRTVPARDMGHSFMVLEPGQARGVPWLASALSVIADLRDYNVQVMDAARQAADYAIILARADENAAYADVNEAVEIERRMIVNAPPGWTPHQMKPEQPSTQYKDFVESRLRELGRAVNMPLMMVLLDSQGHNYSSARFDGQIYARGIQQLQAQIERRDLNRILSRLQDRAELAGLLPRRPDDVRFVWTWPSLPSVDPVKDAQAAEIRLRTGVSNLIRELSAGGYDLDDHIAALKRVVDSYKAAGLSLPVYDTTATVIKPDEDEGKKKQDELDEQEAEETARRLLAKRNGHANGNGRLSHV